MKFITIITPTFNRVTELINLYYSLRIQTSKKFIWLIIDDGSTDNTKCIVSGFTDLNIKYIKKENGGKHTALNLAFDNLETELAFIVDSDDKLIYNAIEIIENDWKKYANKTSICGLVYKRISSNGDSITDNFKSYEFEENYNDYVINHHINGDKAEVFRSSILKKYRFPEYPNEKFVGEGVIWSQIAHMYNMIFINRGIYICDYLEGGLTNSGRKMRIKNPLGGMFHSKEYLSSNYSFKIREKNALLYLMYARFAKKKVLPLIFTGNSKLLLLINIIPSFILYKIWNRKYLKGGRK